MRIAVISDIHSNLAALRAVLADAGDVDETWCLGDLVGYGPQPNECIAHLRRLAPRLVCIAGNHDYAALGKLDSGDFNRDARDAVLWTQEHLTPDKRAYLDGLTERATPAGFLLAHGSPRYPIWEYVVSLSVAQANFAEMVKQGWPDVCFIGHSHLPLIFVDGAGDNGMPAIEYPDVDAPIALGERRMLINPGSVGQPRDGNPAASYLILDSSKRTVAYRRVAYDIATTQRLMRATQQEGGKGRLSDRLINRLAHGV